MADLDAFGKWLKRRRKGLDLTRAALAKLAACSASSIVRLEAGDLRPSSVLAEALAGALAIPAEERERFIRFARGESSDSPSFSSQPDGKPSPVAVSPPHHLPAALTRFLGRKEEMATVCELLTQADVRLLTLTGPPGVGKSRLSIAVANHLTETASYPDGIYFVPLAPIRDAQLVASAVAQALGVREPAGSGREQKPLQGALKEFLRPKRLLLLLDNFEQVMAAAPMVGEWLVAAPGLQVLVTSREVLRSYGEYEYPVPPLAVPDINRLPPPQARSFYTRNTAIQLFKERAKAVQHDFSLTAENIHDVTRICAWLDGLPLAIEMAAAQVKWLPIDQLYQQLSHRLTLLTGGPRDLTPRQQSLTGAIEWSYHLLSAEQQRLFELLGVFVGGCDVEGVQRVLEIGDWRLEIGESLIARLQSLVEKSLLRYETAADGAIRFMFLETLREFAQERLRSNGLMEAARQAHAQYYLRLAQTAETHLVSGGNQAIWLKRLERENNNLRAALVWATESAGRATFALELGRAMYQFWYAHGYLSEGRSWLETILAMDESASLLRSYVLNSAGSLAWLQGDYSGAARYHQQALAIQEPLEDQAGMCRSLESLAILAATPGDYGRAKELLEQTLVMRRKIGDAPKMLSTLSNLAIVVTQLGEFDYAEELQQESIALSRTTGHQRSLGRSLQGLGELRLALADYSAALAAFQESLLVRQELGDRLGLVHSLASAAAALLQLEKTETAVCLMAASVKLQEELGMGTLAVNRAQFEANQAKAQMELGQEGFGRVWAEGRAMSVTEAIALATDG
jgi:predicted ATPase/transcriptional regulator with XRE-family HTH domain